MVKQQKHDFLRTGMIVGILFVVISLLCKPGELNLLTPQHSDLYRYFLTSQKPWSIDDWISPRPLMVVFLKIIGIFESQQLLLFLLAVPSVMFPVFLIHYSTVSGLSKGWLPSVVFCTVVFGSAHFYPTFQLDYGGMLSGCFTVVALYQGWSFVQKKEEPRLKLFFTCLVWVILSIETKPNYSILLLCAAFWAVVNYPGLRARALALSVLLVVFGVFLIDKLMGSPFVASSGTDSPYAVIFDPIRNVNALGAYLKAAFSPPLEVAAMVSCVALAFLKKWRILVVGVVFFVSASIPMSLIPNRIWASYAWYSTVVVGFVVMMAVSVIVGELKHPSTIRKAAFGLALSVIIVEVVAHAFLPDPSLAWIQSQQRRTANIIRSLRSVDNYPTRGRILLAGIRGPYHPLRNTNYMTRVFPNLGDFDVLLRASELPWNRMSHEQKNGVYIQDIDIRHYSAVYIFNDDGSVKATLLAEQLNQMPTAERDLMFFCGGIDVTNEANLPNMVEALKCLNSEERFSSTIEIGERLSASNQEIPWVFMQLAPAYESLGLPEKAQEALKKAGGL